MMVLSNSRKRSQAGTAAIEFAFIFPILFGITYATVVYGYIFFAQQTLNNIAEEAARSVVRVDPAIPGYAGTLSTTAEASIAKSLANLPFLAREAVTRSFVPGTDTASNPVVTITVALPTAALRSSGFATITLPFIGAFPPLPVNLTAAAVVRVN